MFVVCVALAAALVAQEVDYKAETARYSLYRADTAAERLRAHLNDWGMMSVARGVAPRIKSLLALIIR